jgi:hypothetical protein
MKKKTYCLFIFLFATASTFAQSPWTREQGKSYLQLGYTSLNYDAYQRSGTRIENEGKFSDNTVQVYSEYGITDKFEAQLIIPYKYVSVEDAGGSEYISGLGNITLGLKYKLYDKNWKVAGGIQYQAASAIYDNENGISTGFNAATILPYVSVGSSYKKFYYFANVGYGYMDNNYSDFLKATFEIGYNIIKNGHIMLVYDTRNIVSKESAFLNDAAQSPSYQDRQTFNALGFKANYEFVVNKFGVNIASFGASGIDNAPLAPTLNLGAYLKL